MAGGGGDMPPPGMVNVEIEEQIAAAMVLAELGGDKGPFLNGMIAVARNGNTEKLQGVLLFLKGGLSLKEAELSLSLTDVMECEDLIPVLIRGLTSSKVSIQLNASWVICDILMRGTPAQREKVIVGEGAAIYPALLKMLAIPKEKIWQLALNTLVWMFIKERTRPQLQDPAIIPAIAKLAEKTDDLAQLRNIGKVAGFFCQRDDIYVCPPHSLDNIQKLVALFRILYRKTTDDQITSEVTACFVFFLNVEGSAKEIVSGGVLPWVVAHMSHPNSVVRFAVICILSMVGRAGSQMLDLFKALKGTEGLKDFYKCVRNSKVTDPGTGVEDGGDMMKNYSLEFLQSVEDTLVKGKGDVALKSGLVNAILESGFVVSLVKCLEEDETPEMFSFLAISILSKMMIEVGPHRLGPVIEAGAVPLLVKLLKSSRKAIRWLAVVCLGQGNLMKAGPKVRDELIRQGGIDTLIGLLEGEGREEAIGILPIIICFEDLLAAQPRVGLDKYEKLLECLKERLDPFMLAKLHYRGQMLIRMFRCVSHLADHGKDGVELVEKKGLLEKIIEILPFATSEAQRVGLDTLIGMCKVDKKYVFIQKGILEDFELLCRSHGGDFAFRYKVFFDYLGKGLTPGQQSMLQHSIEMEQSALVEIHKALKGSADPVAVDKAKINEVLSRQAGVGVSVS